ncbi:P-loop NTPase [Tundrisphaera lichenicola]|uniref:P-loop NTPase n=1 Tax=Tundrisphaera lichenicola TaxID=2029860 RepID=UPI003EBA0C89
MSDQADGLRQLVRARSGTSALADLPSPSRKAGPAARSLVLTSGKGGVGTSNLALNLAIALGERGSRVLLVDADLGLANIDLLCGLSPVCDLGDVLMGGRPLADAIVDGPAGIRIIPGAHASRTLIEALGDAPGRLIEELAGLEASSDFLVVDAGSGLGASIGTLASSADEVIVVTTPEPTSVADAHAAIHRFRRLMSPPTIRAVVNQAASVPEAVEVLDRLSASSRQFFGAVVDGLGHIRADPHVPLAVRARRPFTVAYPGAAASRDVRRLARVLAGRDRTPPRSRRPGFFASLAARWDLGRFAR